MNAWRLVEWPLELFDVIMTVIGTTIGLGVTWFVQFAKWIFTIGAGTFIGSVVSDYYEPSKPSEPDQYLPALESISVELDAVTDAVLELNSTLQVVLDSAAHDDPTDGHPF